MLRRNNVTLDKGGAFISLVSSLNDPMQHNRPSQSSGSCFNGDVFIQEVATEHLSLALGVEAASKLQGIGCISHPRSATSIAPHACATLAPCNGTALAALRGLHARHIEGLDSDAEALMFAGT